MLVHIHQKSIFALTDSDIGLIIYEVGGLIFTMQATVSTQYTYACVRACVRVCVCVRACVCVCVCRCAYMCEYIVNEKSLMREKFCGFSGSSMNRKSFPGKC